ncbi:MAG: heavy metal-associated domain-containing protein [Xenococcaceae cyanobacterium MO_167.B27]|nr:heavy metal-associated domain-containing protein [Xenococcaceae cyanobacterium MO_167.B27]
MNWFFKRSPTKEIQLQVEELHCEMCAQTVREALQKVAGVNKVKVNLSQKKVTVAHRVHEVRRRLADLFEIADCLEVSVESLIQALEPTGYRAKPILAAKSK